MTDVCLILEGTYPFTAGGVSTWIHQLVTAMNDLRFSILHIAALPNPRREFKYRLPPNVLDLDDLYLHGALDLKRMSSRRLRVKALDALESLHESIIAGNFDAFSDALPYLRGPDALTPGDLFQSQEAWALVTKFYSRYGEDASFLDFFWTFRSMYQPLLSTLQCPLPPARLYHTVSTGYAGLLSAVARATQDAGVVLTEHGVYTYERQLEISQATWIYTPHQERFRVQRSLSFFKRLWLGLFELLGKMSYRHADRIITLFEGNRLKQIAAGAPADKITIIPNGIDVEFYHDIELKAQKGGARTVAFIGRVVPIKDVKTFIHAAKVVNAEMPKVEFLVLGPTDEEPEYTEECRDLVKALGLDDVVKFAGKVDMRDWYSRIDLVVLTSLSEAQPYVILEANAIGVPVVATDVGACREMLEGRTPDDRRIGPSGLLTGVAHPDDTASAIMRILSEPQLWNAMSEAGRARTRTFYDQADLISRYLNLYEHMMR
ncbi:MAG: GT4 family glycosyltransferase PelF [Elusimicrobia bacterium]|nr:GT4 family glycosyltransferase PelF [Elusimicrobiota bacterium]